MTAHDTLRWGDSETMAIPAVGGHVSTFQSKQLVQAHWRWPLSWNVLIVLTPQFNADEVFSFTATMRIIVGVGQAQALVPFVYTLAPVAGVYSPVVDQKFIPGENLQIDVQVKGTPASASKESLMVSVWAAPQTEPHAMTEVLERISGKHPEQVQWMPEGFQEEPLGYRR